MNISQNYQFENNPAFGIKINNIKNIKNLGNLGAEASRPVINSAATVAAAAVPVETVIAIQNGIQKDSAAVSAENSVSNDTQINADELENKVEETEKPVEDLEQSGKNNDLHEELLKLTNNMEKRPLLFEEQSDEPHLYNLTNPKPERGIDFPPAEIREGINALSEEAKLARELGNKFIEEVMNSPEYKKQKENIIDINNKYKEIISVESPYCPEEAKEAYKNGKKEFLDPAWGGALVRIMSEDEQDALFHGSTYINDGKIRIDYSLCDDGNVGYISCNDATKPIDANKRPDMYVSSTGNISLSDKRGCVTSYSYYKDGSSVKRATREIFTKDYHEDIKFYGGEVLIGKYLQ